VVVLIVFEVAEMYFFRKFFHFSYVYIIFSIHHVYIYASYFVCICHPTPLITNLLCGLLFIVSTSYVLVSTSTIVVVVVVVVVLI
jgi:hypothetical protein